MAVKVRSVLNITLRALMLGLVAMSSAAHAVAFIEIEKACADPFCSPPVFDLTLTDLGTAMDQSIDDLAVGEIRTILLSSAGDFRITEIVPPDSVLFDISVTGITAFTVNLPSSSVDLTLADDETARVVFTNANAVPEPNALGLIALGLLSATYVRRRRAS